MSMRLENRNVDEMLAGRVERAETFVECAQIRPVSGCPDVGDVAAAQAPETVSSPYQRLNVGDAVAPWPDAVHNF